MLIWEEVTFTKSQQKFQLDSFGCTKLKVSLFQPLGIYHQTVHSCDRLCGYTGLLPAFFSLGNLHNTC